MLHFKSESTAMLKGVLPLVLFIPSSLSRGVSLLAFVVSLPASLINILVRSCVYSILFFVPITALLCHPISKVLFWLEACLLQLSLSCGCMCGLGGGGLLLVVWPRRVALGMGEINPPPKRYPDPKEIEIILP